MSGSTATAQSVPPPQADSGEDAFDMTNAFDMNEDAAGAVEDTLPEFEMSGLEGDFNQLASDTLDEIAPPEAAGDEAFSGENAIEFETGLGGDADVRVGPALAEDAEDASVAMENDSENSLDFDLGDFGAPEEGQTEFATDDSFPEPEPLAMEEDNTLQFESVDEDMFSADSLAEELDQMDSFGQQGVSETVSHTDSANEQREEAVIHQLPGHGGEIEEVFTGMDDGELGELGDDVLSGSDMIGTKLDLARAYIDMDDADGARGILSEVIEEGSDDQKQEAQELMQKIG
jgi:pilus assembly protein FimV